MLSVISSIIIINIIIAIIIIIAMFTPLGLGLATFSNAYLGIQRGTRDSMQNMFRLRYLNIDISIATHSDKTSIFQDFGVLHHSDISRRYRL